MEFTNTDTKTINFDHLKARFQKPVTKATSERAEQIERFLTRLNNSRLAGGYKPLTPGFVGSKMSHIPTDELHAFYQKLDTGKNFCALWWYYCVPKKK
jgi:hypothetical protein